MIVTPGDPTGREMVQASHARLAPGPAGERQADCLGFFLHPHQGWGTLTVWHYERGGSKSLF